MVNEKDKIPFNSVEDFFDEVSSDYGFEYQNKWYDICFDDPFTALGKVEIYEERKGDTDGDHALREEHFDSLDDLVHNFKIGARTLAEIICDENDISRSVLPVKRPRPTWGERAYVLRDLGLPFEPKTDEEFEKEKKDLLDRLVAQIKDDGSK